MITHQDPQDTPSKDIFRKSSFSGGGDCVEVAFDANGIFKVRDSKDPKGPVLTFTKSEWIAFIKGVQEGEFNDCASRNSRK